MKLYPHWLDLLHVLFPETCVGCERTLLYQEEMLCTTCLFHLPKTDFHLDSENETARQLWGKLDFQTAISMLKLSKDSITEQLIHQLKYGNQPHIGLYLGKMYGQALLSVGILSDIDCIVPIPLHRSKLRKRGYNQAAYFAIGLARALSVPCEEHAFIRQNKAVSQTQKSRIDRYDNVEGVFTCTNVEKLAEKHILLVDDVLTTGATIAAAGNILIEQTHCKVSVATIARA